MIRAAFLSHSGFLVELDSRYLLFDWWEGDLPALSGKPLLCFASHRHPDHFDPRIFALDDGSRDVTFVLSHDIRLTESHRKRWGVSEGTAAKCVSVSYGESRTLSGVTVEALRSTDEGVAFLVTADGKTIYHAGDLNWWHWEGEDPGWNRSMEVDFKGYIAPLRGRSIDLCMAPLDPRLESAEGWGLAWLMGLADIKAVLPMHQWGDPSPTGRFQAIHPQWADRIANITQEGPCYEN